jgi:hypothetical protein
MLKNLDKYTHTNTMDCKSFRAINDELKARSRQLLSVNVLISGLTYRLKVLQLPVEPIVIGIELRESKGPVEEGEVKLEVAPGVMLTVYTSPLRLTVTRNGSVVFTNNLLTPQHYGRGYFHLLDDGLHMPILINPGEGFMGLVSGLEGLTGLGRDLRSMWLTLPVYPTIKPTWPTHSTGQPLAMGF